MLEVVFEVVERPGVDVGGPAVERKVLGLLGDKYSEVGICGKKENRIKLLAYQECAPNPKSQGRRRHQEDKEVTKPERNLVISCQLFSLGAIVDSYLLFSAVEHFVATILLKSFWLNFEGSQLL